MKSLNYEYVIQEQINDYWLDRYTTNDRKFVEELLKVYRKKYSTKFRVVRLVLWDFF